MSSTFLITTSPILTSLSALTELISFITSNIIAFGIGEDVFTATTAPSLQRTVEVTVRTGVLKDENGDYILMDKFINNTIRIKGIVEYYNPSASSDDDEGEVTDGFYYQIKVVSTADLVITD